MLGIGTMPPCGFGNRILYYYNLRQEAKNRGVGYFCVPWDGHNHFQGEMLGEFSPNERYELLNFCLGDKFYDHDELPTRDVFKLSVIPLVSVGTCAIHFRGTDFHSWNPESILNYQYYYDSINIIKDEISRFILFTDDENLESYKRTKEYLDSINATYFYGENTANRKNYITDFSYMTECDWIISSPSTFCLAAGFIGKKKNIIHSEKWITSRVKANDKFWCDLASGGNEDYKLWRMV